jgi:hypothetical protein
MANVHVEARPNGRPGKTHIEDYVVETDKITRSRAVTRSPDLHLKLFPALLRASASPR